MSGHHTLEARDLTLGYGAAPIVEELSLTVPRGKVTTIVGANACGKSTLLRGLARLLRPAAGQVLLDGRSIHDLPTKQVARVMGLLPQSPVAPDGLTVVDLVGRGRSPHQGWFRQWSAADETAVAAALEATGTLDLAHRTVDELSGGQRQRVWIAMALAQETDVLLLDEPTTFLDVAHQVDVLDLLADLNQRRGTTVVAVLHDLNLAARYSDHMVALLAGRVVAAGPPRAVVTEATVGDVFGMRCTVIDDPVAGTPLVIPLGRKQAGPAASRAVAAGPAHDHRDRGHPGPRLRRRGGPRRTPVADVRAAHVRRTRPRRLPPVRTGRPAGPAGQGDGALPRAIRSRTSPTSPRAGTGDGWRSTPRCAARCARTRSAQRGSPARSRPSTSTSCCTSTSTAAAAGVGVGGRRPSG